MTVKEFFEQKGRRNIILLSFIHKKRKRSYQELCYRLYSICNLKFIAYEEIIYFRRIALGNAIGERPMEQ